MASEAFKPKYDVEHINLSQPSIDYTRGISYFCAEEKSPFWGWVLVIVGIPLLFIYVGIIVIPIGIYLIWRSYKHNTSMVTDAEIDRICENQISGIKSTALQKLGIDEDQVQESAPILVSDYYYRKLNGSSLMCKLGKDGILRSSNYNVIMFFFSADQIFSYCYQFSLLKDMKQEYTDECFYGDIVSVATCYEAITEEPLTTGNVINLATNLASTVSKGYFGIAKAAAKASSNILKKEKKTDYFTSFVVTTSGSTEMSATFSDMSTVERSINGMRSLLRSKKQHLHNRIKSID
jgi:hypothetical protein